MTQEQLELPLSSSKSASPGRVVIAGVIGACALGAGLGLWARPPAPAHVERPASVEPGQRRALQIVLEDIPTPVVRLLEVLPGDVAAVGDTTSPGEAPSPPREPVAPPLPTDGLVKVAAPIAPEPLVVPALEAKPKPKAAAPAKPKAVAKPARDETRLQKPKVAEAAAKQAARPSTPKAEKKAKAQTAKNAQAVKLAKAAKAQKAKPTKLAKAEPKKVEKAARAKPARLTKVAKAVKAPPKTIKAEARRVARSKPVRVAQAKPKATVAKPATRILAARKPPKVDKAATPPAQAAAPRKIVIPRGAGPLRIARGATCGSVDPGAAAACSDRRLDARERQLAQAYRNAEAAGAPAALLQRQQARWLQSRAAAARDAPWAVEDVYEARISELNDLSSRGGRIDRVPLVEPSNR